MKTIGLVGGVASGKSLVAQMLAERGAGVLDADRAGHDVLATDTASQQALVDRWGPGVQAADGSIDRRAVAQKVFAAGEQGTEDREFLEEVLHPRIRQRIEAELQQLAKEDRLAVVLDAPLLLEADWGPMCDLVLMVDVPREKRLAWAQQRGWSEADFARREAAQWPVDEKRRHADVILKNQGSTEELRDAVGRLWVEYIESSPAAS